jgi:prevent-host-death family protein
MYDTDMSSVPVSEARATLPDILERVQAGEEVTLTRHGVPVAVVVSPTALRARRATTAFQLASELGRLMDDARHRPLGRTSSIDTATAERWVAELDAARRAR